jgi:AmpE protein
MSLISLLIAIAVERSLSSSVWGFQYYFQQYQKFFGKNISTEKKQTTKVTLASIAFIGIPVICVAFTLSIIDNGLIHVALSTVILIICLGCTATRASYKEYLTSAFRGEETTTKLHHQQLLSDKNLPPMGFGQALVWLNYRYYVAIVLFFIAFGAAGAVFYRLLTSVIEQQNKACQEQSATAATDDSQANDFEGNDSKGNDFEGNHSKGNDFEGNDFEGNDFEGNHSEDNDSEEEHSTVDITEAALKKTPEASADLEQSVDESTPHESAITPCIANGCNNHHDILFWVDWLPVRITSFGYMFVGHFSKAMPVWLENCFDFNKPTHQILIDVAVKSEDILVEEHDCTAEPCLLVRLAKRNALLVLAVIAVLTLTGVLS